MALLRDLFQEWSSALTTGPNILHGAKNIHCCFSPQSIPCMYSHCGNRANMNALKYIVYTLWINPRGTLSKEVAFSVHMLQASRLKTAFSFLKVRVGRDWSGGADPLLTGNVGHICQPVSIASCCKTVLTGHRQSEVNHSGTQCLLSQGPLAQDPSSCGDAGEVGRRLKIKHEFMASKLGCEGKKGLQRTQMKRGMKWPKGDRF